MRFPSLPKRNSKKYNVVFPTIFFSNIMQSISQEEIKDILKNPKIISASCVMVLGYAAYKTNLSSKVYAYSKDNIMPLISDTYNQAKTFLEKQIDQSISHLPWIIQTPVRTLLNYIWGSCAQYVSHNKSIVTGALVLYMVARATGHENIGNIATAGVLVLGYLKSISEYNHKITHKKIEDLHTDIQDVKSTIKKIEQGQTVIAEEVVQTREQVITKIKEESEKLSKELAETRNEMKAIKADINKNTNQHIASVNEKLENCTARLLELAQKIDKINNEERDETITQLGTELNFKLNEIQLEYCNKLTQLKESLQQQADSNEKKHEETRQMVLSCKDLIQKQTETSGAQLKKLQEAQNSEGEQLVVVQDNLEQLLIQAEQARELLKTLQEKYTQLHDAVNQNTEKQQNQNSLLQTLQESQAKTAQEQHTILQDLISGLELFKQQHENALEKFFDSLEEVKKDVINVNKKVDTIDNKVTSLDEKVGMLQKQISSLEQQLADNKKKQEAQEAERKKQDEEKKKRREIKEAERKKQDEMLRNLTKKTEGTTKQVSSLETKLQTTASSMQKDLNELKGQQQYIVEALDRTSDRLQAIQPGENPSLNAVPLNYSEYSGVVKMHAPKFLTFYDS